MRLTSLTYPDLLGGAGSRLTFHVQDQELALYHRQEFARELSFHRGFPDEVFEYRNVFLVQDKECSALYDESGRRLDESALRRGVDPPIFIRARERIEPPTEFRAIDGPMLFLSKYVGGWGHVITESVSRLWARERYPELAAMPAIFASREILEEGAASQLFAAMAGLQVATSREFKPPLKLAQAFAPAPSFVNRASAYSGHAAVLRGVAERMLGNVVAAPDSRPVYFSRTRLQSFTKVFENEAELESALEGRGFRVVHPESLDLRAQIEVINAHRVFVGVIGSAMHSLFFALRGEEKVAHLVCPYPGRNFALADAVVGNESHYVCTVDEIESDGAMHYKIDVPGTLAYFKDQGLL